MNDTNFVWITMCRIDKELQGQVLEKIFKQDELQKISPASLLKV